MLGDARSGKFAENLVGFGRALRRAGVQIDSSKIALATQAAQIVGLGNKHHLSAALQSVLISEQQDLAIFSDLFAAYFKDPQLANKLLSQMLPSAQGQAEPSKKPRVKEALTPQKSLAQKLNASTSSPEKKIDFDAAMTASDLALLRNADFNALSASEYVLVDRLAREVRIDLPTFTSRRSRLAGPGKALDWPATIRSAGLHQGDVIRLRYRERKRLPVPIVVLVDVSGSMERYARLLLCFLHASLRHHQSKHAFAFGTHLTDLSGFFALADTDSMLTKASASINDFAGGTRLGDSLAELRKNHHRILVGKRTLVLVISDGLDTGDKDALAKELQWLRLHSGKIAWLNPLLRFDGYAPLAQGAAVLHRYCHTMLAVHNVSKLEMLATSIRKLLANNRSR